MKLEHLPGGDLVERGLRDLEDSRDTVVAPLVPIAAPRLREAGLHVRHVLPDPEHRLYGEAGRSRFRLGSLPVQCAAPTPDELRERSRMRALAEAERLWRFLSERSLFIAREGRLSFYHYDPYAQALAKIERGQDKDLGDVRELTARGFVEPQRLRELHEAIEPRLHRYPAIDPSSFRRRRAGRRGRRAVGSAKHPPPGGRDSDPAPATPRGPRRAY